MVVWCLLAISTSGTPPALSFGSYMRSDALPERAPHGRFLASKGPKLRVDGGEQSGNECAIGAIASAATTSRREYERTMVWAGACGAWKADRMHGTAEGLSQQGTRGRPPVASRLRGATLRFEGAACPPSLKQVSENGGRKTG